MRIFFYFQFGQRCTWTWIIADPHYIVFISIKCHVFRDSQTASQSYVCVCVCGGVRVEQWRGVGQPMSTDTVVLCLCVSPAFPKSRRQKWETVEKRDQHLPVMWAHNLRRLSESLARKRRPRNHGNGSSQAKKAEASRTAEEVVGFSMAIAVVSWESHDSGGLALGRCSASVGELPWCCCWCCCCCCTDDDDDDDDTCDCSTDDVAESSSFKETTADAKNRNFTETNIGFRQESMCQIKMLNWLRDDMQWI